MRLLSLVLVLMVLAGPASAQPESAPVAAPSLPPIDRFPDFLNVSLLSAPPYALAFGGSLLDQMGNFPEEWEGQLGKRYLARQGMGFASDAIGHSAAAVLGHRVLYDSCACRGWSRVNHAMGRAFVSMRADGRPAPNYSLWIAKFSAAGLANTWYPKSYTTSDILREGSLGIIISGGLNVLDEFTPELLKLVPFF